MKSIENGDENELPHIKIQLPNVPLQIALSCDNTLLAVDVEVRGTPFLVIYSVESLLTDVSIKKNLIKFISSLIEFCI